jgi:hypothetical protein
MYLFSSSGPLTVMNLSSTGARVGQALGRWGQKLADHVIFLQNNAHKVCNSTHQQQVTHKGRLSGVLPDAQLLLCSGYSSTYNMCLPTAWGPIQ